MVEDCESFLPHSSSMNALTASDWPWFGHVPKLSIILNSLSALTLILLLSFMAGQSLGRLFKLNFSRVRQLEASMDTVESGTIVTQHPRFWMICLQYHIENLRSSRRF